MNQIANKYTQEHSLVLNGFILLKNITGDVLFLQSTFHLSKASQLLVVLALIKYCNRNIALSM